MKVCTSIKTSIFSMKSVSDLKPSNKQSEIKKCLLHEEMNEACSQ